MTSPAPDVKAPDRPRAGLAGMTRRAASGLKRAGRIALDQLYPPACLACSAPVEIAQALCPACWALLRPITPPFCPRLGLPFGVPMGPDALSAQAIADPPPFGRARSAVIYNEIARSLVSRLKYGDRPEFSGFCAALMAGAGADLLGRDAVLVPVPLHPARLFVRRYNQAGELARALSARLGLHTAFLLRRKRHGRPQVGLSAEARRRNAAGIFEAHPDLVLRLSGRRIVLVDDVITTGATVNAASRVLLRAGAERVDVLSFARVVIGADLPI